MSLPPSQSTDLSHETESTGPAATRTSTNHHHAFEPLSVDTHAEAEHSNTDQGPVSKSTKALYSVHISLLVLYLFITARTTKPFWLIVVCGVIVVLYFIVTVVMFYRYFAYVVRKKLQIVGVFATTFMILYNLIGGGVLTDSIGLVMISVTFAITCPELKGDLLGVIGGESPVGAVLPL
ncbi:hypothetical protein V8F33_013833 [Rhypophila sp. PSN 637]